MGDKSGLRLEEISRVAERNTPLTELFSIGPVIGEKDAENALKMLQTRINDFMLNPDIRVESVNGPYANHVPPEKHLPMHDRVTYTASVLYYNEEF